MTQIDWRISGTEFGACNCDWGCPCQFNALPSKGHCTGGLWMQIDQGYFGDTRLDGVVWGMMGQWPGALHEGNGTLATYIDERATTAQQRAIVEIVSGAHSAEGTLFNIFGLICPTKLEPVRAPIEFAMDAHGRSARVRIAGVLEVDGEPIRNPVTGDPHFPRLELPGGFEFKTAEFASSNLKSMGAIELDNRRGHGHFAQVSWGPSGYLG